MAAEVSSATVSRVINNTGTVSDAVRQRIEAAIARLGYVPNGAARALASNRTWAVGIVVPKLLDPNFATTVQKAQAQLHQAGFRTLIATSDHDPKQEWEQVQSLVMHGIDGIILAGSEHPPGMHDFLKARHVPYAETWTMTKDDTPCIGFDHAAAACRMARHLLDLGHRRIGIVSGPGRCDNRARDQIKGIRQAFSERGLTLPGEYLIERPCHIAEGQQAMRLLMTMAPRPTAVLCGDDLLAFGALIECKVQKLNVPGDVSVTGFGDLEFASQIVPSLTTIHVPAEAIGQKAADYLIAAIEGRPCPVRTELTTDIIARNSTAPPCQGN